MKRRKQHPKRVRSESKPRSAQRGGFTLVELLVSTGLVVLMMYMFAVVFGLATQSMTTMRGRAELDQRARTLHTIISNDILTRTSRIVLAFANDEPEPDESVDPDDFARRRFDLRRGYFYISENDPDNDADDVLQFSAVLSGGDIYYGRASLLGTTADRNQPDFDDGQIGNETGTSRNVEICYFLRHGNLYRRVLLIRDEEDPDQLQPEDSSGNKFFDPSYVPPYTSAAAPRSFWGEFDYSAHFDSVITGRAEFHGGGDLQNDTAGGAFPLARPYHRFGHNHATGLPREYVGADFIGRFTHEETSHNTFDYPARNALNPMDPATALTVSNGVVTAFTGGTRRSEDILMTNVHAFDVKVWDEGLSPPRFVDIGHSIVGGDFYQDATGGPPNRNLHIINGITYGPSTTITENRVFDTWHRNLDIDNADGDDSHTTGQDPPPFRPEDSSGNPRRLRAIQITIRYHDVSSDQVRQVTIVQSLMNN